MEIQNVTIIFIIVLLLMAGPSTADSDQLLRGMPSGVQHEVLTLNMIHNGHRLSVASLHGQGALTDVMHAFKTLWVAQHKNLQLPPFLEHKAHPWQILSRQYKGWNQVVQLRRSQRGFTGYISVLSLQRSASVLPAVPAPQGVKRILSTESSDFGSRSATDVLLVPQSESATIHYYRNYYRGQGWRIVAEHTVPSGHTLMVDRQLQRAAASAELVVSAASNGESWVTLNRVYNESDLP